MEHAQVTHIILCPQRKTPSRRELENSHVSTISQEGYQLHYIYSEVWGADRNDLVEKAD